MLDFGLTPREFEEHFREKRPRLQNAALAGQPFGWSDLDDVLHQIEPIAPMFQVFNQGLVAEDRYTDRSVEFGTPRRRLNKRRFFDELRNGSTLVVNCFENYSPRILRLCAEVARFTGWQAMSNAYLSLGGRGTFGKHWDTHDVFAIQLLGRKRWQVYPPTFALPLSSQGSEGSGQECPAVPVLDCVLNPGDLLYVPRGWWHQAIPFDEPSLHVSIGAYGATVHDYLLWICARQLPAVEGARHSLTAAFDDKALDAVLQSLRKIALEGARRAQFEREVASRARASSELDTELFFAAGAEGLTSGATLRLTAVHSLQPEQAELVVNGARLRLNPLSRAIVMALAATTSLSIDGLYEQLPHEHRAAIRAALLDLAQHEVLSIERW